MVKGDIVLVLFPFSDLAGNKLRPALVIGSSPDEVTVLFITSQIKWPEPTDILLNPDSINGIKKQSLLRVSKIATLDRILIKGKLGVIDNDTLQKADDNLKIFLRLL